MYKRVLATFALTTVAVLSAQDGLTTARFRTVPEGQMGDYLRGEAGFWKAAHERAARNGGLHYWVVLARTAPNGPELPHQAITLNVTEGPGSYSMGGIIQEMRKDKSLEKLYQETNTSSRLHHGEMWQLIEEAWSGGSLVKEGSQVYAVVNYIKTRPGQAATYREIEKDWQKLQAARVQAGTLLGWQAFGVRFPSGTEAEYNFVTIDYYQGLDFLKGGGSRQIFEKVFPGQKWADFNRRTGESRNMIRRDLYRVAVDLRP